MEFSVKFKSGWSIVYIQGGTSYILVFLSQKIIFVLANGADTDKMPYYEAFHLGLHCLLKYLCRLFCSSKV